MNSSDLDEIHLKAGEISLKWDDFSLCKQLFPDCPT